MTPGLKPATMAPVLPCAQMDCPFGCARTHEDALHTMDDFEIEVSDLWEDDPPDWDMRGGDMDGDGTARTTQTTYPGTTARWRTTRSPFTPRLTRREKLGRAGVAVMAVLVTCVFVVVTSAPVRKALGGVVAGSAAAHITAAGTETIYFENGVPWGQLALDGHPVHQSDSQLFGSIQIGKGRHTLTYSDAPFPSLRCHLTVPLSREDTCPLEMSPPANAVGRDIFVRVVNLGATPNLLPSGSFRQLVGVTDGALGNLTSSTLVLPGNRYLAALGKSQVATRPLLATLHYRINTDPSVVAPYLPGQHLCSQICFLGDDTHSPGTWSLLALAQVTWTYALPDGPVVAENAPAGSLSGSSTALVTVHVTWDGTWHAEAKPLEDQFGASPLCDIAQATLPLVAPQHGIEPSYTQRQLPAVNAADGCLIETQVNTPGVESGPAYVLYRFGVLLAANSEAQALYPSLPAAGVFEQGLVRQMVGPGGFG